MKSILDSIVKKVDIGFLIMLFLIVGAATSKIPVTKL
jgi:hypothetical protein